VIHELFNFMRSEEIITTPLVLNDIIYKVINTLKEDGQLGKFTTVFELAERIPKVKANALQLEKVLLNIIRNGIEAMHDSGLVEGSIIVIVQNSENDSYAQVTIHDSGPGIDAHLIQHIFEPFYSSKTGDLGMGLAISRTIMEAQGGQLWCQIDNNPGASFHLTIPYISGSFL
jgi:two-component system, LuxR family, sensor kinase FixL